MRRAFNIGGRDVAFSASGATPRRYRVQTGRDIFEDFRHVAEAVAASIDDEVSSAPETLGVFEDIAYCMAREAEPRAVPDTPEAWLEGFPALPIMAVFPRLELLWLDNLTQTVTPSKK